MNGRPLLNAFRSVPIVGMLSLFIWLRCRVLHALRCAVFALPLVTFTGGGFLNGGPIGAVVGALVGFAIGVMLAFPDELADALE